MNDARDGRGPDGEETEAGREPADDTAGLDAGDWLAAQFADDGDDDDAVDGVVDDGADDDGVVDDGADDDGVEDDPVDASVHDGVADDGVADDGVADRGLQTAATPISAETVRSAPFTVPPAPTAESEVVKSSGHPMALDLSALAGTMPPPSPTEPTPSAEPAPPAEGVVEHEDVPDAHETGRSEAVAPPRYQVPPAVAPRPAAPPAALPPADPSAAVDDDDDDDEPDASGGASVEEPEAGPVPRDEPGPFTALITPPVAPQPVFPSSFDWSTPAASDDRAEGPSPDGGSQDDVDLSPAAGEDAEEAPVSSTDAADDAQTRAFDLPAAAVPAAAAAPAPSAVADGSTPVEAEAGATPVGPEPTSAGSEPELASEPEVEFAPEAASEPEVEFAPGAASEPEVGFAPGAELESATEVELPRASNEPESAPEPAVDLVEPVAELDPEPTVEQSQSQSQPESEPASEQTQPATEVASEPEPAIEQTEPATEFASESGPEPPTELPSEPANEPEPGTAESAPAEPWWIAEHHEMTRRERREAEAAGVVVPPAVAASPDAVAAAAAAAAADDESAAGAPAAPPAGLPFAAPSGGASAPSADEPEPTFTELLGIVRPSGDARESVEDTPGDPSADAGRSDLVDPGPLPAGGSWALSDELPVDEPSAPAAEDGELVTTARDDEPVDLDDPFAALLVESEEDAPDAATAALPLAGAGLAGAGAAGVAAETETTPAAAGERPRSVPHTDAELPGLSVEAGSPSASAAASSGASPLVPRGGPSATSTPSGPGAGSSPAGPGGGIASWSRGRKVLLGVAAALVIVLALVALFVLSRSLFAGTPQPTEAPAAAVATRTVTAAPAELPQEAAAGPLSTGTHPWSDLQGGECFSAFENAWQQDYEVVDCGQPHVAQLASIGALDADPAAAYPGSDALQSQMSVLCTGASALDLAAASTWADAQFSASWPSTDAEWAAGVRSYWCFVDRASGEPMTTSVAPAAA